MKIALLLLLQLAPAASDTRPFPLIQALDSRLQAARSATVVLEQWCAEHALASAPRVVARLLRGIDKPASAEQRARLGVGPDTPLAYRRVQLSCGDHLLSEADNWYVPSRLSADMNRLLEQTDTPFGKVVQPLQPYRRTIATRMLWTGAGSAIPAALFEHSAVLYNADHQPIAEVRETYQRGLLDFL